MLRACTTTATSTSLALTSSVLNRRVVQVVIRAIRITQAQLPQPYLDGQKAPIAFQVGSMHRPGNDCSSRGRFQYREIDDVDLGQAHKQPEYRRLGVGQRLFHKYSRPSLEWQTPNPRMDVTCPPFNLQTVADSVESQSVAPCLTPVGQRQGMLNAPPVGRTARIIAGFPEPCSEQPHGCGGMSGANWRSPCR
jgi:hypothetical protein